MSQSVDHRDESSHSVDSKGVAATTTAAETGDITPPFPIGTVSLEEETNANKCRSFPSRLEEVKGRSYEGRPHAVVNSEEQQH